MTTQTIFSECPNCGVTFGQPDDPGRKRVFCSNRCRQANYRARTGKTGHEAQQDRKRREQQRRDEQARRARERRAREAREQAQRAGAPWTAPRSSDTAAQAKKRATCRRLMDRAEHPRTPKPEAAAARAKAESIRQTYGL